MQDSFKDLANVLRWRIRARYQQHAREDLILAIESLINGARLGWESRAIPWLLAFCITWVSRLSKVGLLGVEFSPPELS